MASCASELERAKSKDGDLSHMLIAGSQEKGRSEQRNVDCDSLQEIWGPVLPRGQEEWPPDMHGCGTFGVCAEAALSSLPGPAVASDVP